MFFICLLTFKNDLYVDILQLILFLNELERVCLYTIKKCDCF